MKNLYIIIINYFVVFAGSVSAQMPVAGFTASPTTVCEGASVAFTDASTGSPTSWSWTFNGGTPGTSTAQNPSVIYNTTGTYDVTLTATNINGSNTTTSTNYITVNPNPLITISPTSSIYVCMGSSVTLTASGASTYSWSPSTGLSNPFVANPVFSPSSTTTYTVIGTDVGGCSDTVTATVSVYSLPIVTVSAAQDTICIGDYTTLSASGASFYQWTPAPGLTATSGSTVMVNPTSTTTYTVTGGDANGCSASTTVTVTVNPLINVTASTDTSICMGQSYQISAFATGGNEGPYNYSWSPPTGLSNPTAPNTLAAPVTTTVYTVTVTDNCGTPSVSDSVVITVNSCVSINEINEFETMKVFPNPSSGQITVFNPMGTPVESIKIYNSLGVLCKVVSTKTLTGNNLKLNLDLPAGPYFVSINNRGESVTIPLNILPGR